jgi:hypothetical protein
MDKFKASFSETITEAMMIVGAWLMMAFAFAAVVFAVNRILYWVQA